MMTLANLQVGGSLEPIELSPVSLSELIEYSDASGDFNPIHTVEAEAKRVGLPGVIAHGMWTMGNLAKLFTPYYEEGFIQDYAIRFVTMLFIDEVVTLKGKLVEKNDDILVFLVVVENQKGKEVIKGSVKFKLFK
ncbi:MULTISPECIES: MaoC/PaaZ C-terminal domain-containing protein [Lysinibacillus]|uniref:MaoC/PaaZ C-terminal domain-containing protein n=1 Tax=Lysinibacillus xylanilyticus TaxID=582475 RepID=A0ABV3VX85_9BACI